MSCVWKNQRETRHHFPMSTERSAITEPEWRYRAARRGPGWLLAVYCPLVPCSGKDRSSREDCLWLSHCRCARPCVCVCLSAWSDRRCPCRPPRPRFPPVVRGTLGGRRAGSGRGRPGCERTRQGSPANQWPESVDSPLQGQRLGGWTSSRSFLWRGMLILVKQSKYHWCLNTI